MNKELNLHIRYYKSGDEEDILKLLTKTFPKWAEFKDPMELWRWKYVDSPLRKFIVVATDGDKLIGCEHYLFFKAKIGNEITSLSYVDDLAIDTEYRGLGIWKKMRAFPVKEQSSYAEYSYSTTSNPILIESYKRRKVSTLPFTVTRMIKTHDIDLFLKSRPMENYHLVKIIYLILKKLNKISNSIRKPIKNKEEFKIKKISEFDNEIDFFWEKIKEDCHFIIEKRHEYLNWRFKDNDKGKHTVFQASKEGKILGYIVIGFKENSNEGQIEDLLTLKDRLDVADSLLKSAQNYLDEIKINTVFYQVVIGNPYHKLSIRNGFIDSHSKPFIQFDCIDPKKRKNRIKIFDNSRPSQVYFNYADTI